MHNLLPVLLCALLLPTAAMAQDDPMTESVALKWTSAERLAVTVRLALPNGCHKPVSMTETVPQGAVPVENAIPVSVKIAIEGTLCTQEYRMHRFDMTVDAPPAAAGVILYELRSGQATKASLYALPKRPSAN